MTKRAAIKAPADPADREKVFHIPEVEGRSDARALADVGLDPKAGAMVTTRAFNKGSFGELSLTDTYDGVRDGVRKFETGDHTAQRAMLISQSMSLDAIFTEMSRRAALNMGEYINASERYMRLALKAQAQCRATIEALDRLANGHTQTVRHVHVDNRGGQAIIADNVHTGGQENGKFDGQSHATGTAGSSSPMLGPDPFGNGVPIPSREGAEAMPYARRGESGCT